jgi:hypothetical protein
VLAAASLCVDEDAQAARVHERDVRQHELDLGDAPATLGEVRRQLGRGVGVDLAGDFEPASATEVDSRNRDARRVRHPGDSNDGAGGKPVGSIRTTRSGEPPRSGGQLLV